MLQPSLVPVPLLSGLPVSQKPPAATVGATPAATVGATSATTVRTTPAATIGATPSLDPQTGSPNNYSCL